MNKYRIVFGDDREVADNDYIRYIFENIDVPVYGGYDEKGKDYVGSLDNLYYRYQKNPDTFIILVKDTTDFDDNGKEYTEYQYSTNEKDTSHEPATISLGHFTDVVKLASLFPSGYTCKENERILASDRIYADETVKEEYNSYSVDNTNQCDPPENYAVWKSDYFTSNGVGSDYILWYSSDILVSDYDLCSLSPENLKLARNEIFARRGRIFDDEELKNYFSSKDWYMGYLKAEYFDESFLLMK
mgnify:CR=1 FL=1